MREVATTVSEEAEAELDFSQIKSVCIGASFLPSARPHSPGRDVTR